jgi:drug/metabolite transporter (DMT)-like permease
MMSLLACAFLLLLAGLWGAAFLFIRIAVLELGPLPLMATRVWVAGLVLLVYARVVGRWPRTWARWRAFVLLGGLNAALPFTMIAFAELTLSASLAAILNATTPLFTALVAAASLHEPLGTRKLCGLALGFTGVAVVVGLGPLVVTPSLVLAAGASLLAACLYGIGGVYAKARFQDVPPLDLAIGQQVGAGLILLAPALANPPAGFPATPTVLSVVALAVLCTALAYLLYFQLLAVVGPTNTLSVTFLIPAFAVLWGALFLREPLGAGLFVGLGVIVLGVVLVTGLALPAVAEPPRRGAPNGDTPPGV